MEIILLESSARKRLTKQKGIYTNRYSLELFLECPFSLTSLKTGHFSCTFLLLYEILVTLFFKFKVKFIKPSRTHVRSTKILELPDWYTFL